MFTVTRDTSIEELTRNIPESVNYMMEKGIVCIQCGEPIWGTLSEVCTEKGYAPADIDAFVIDLNKLIAEPQSA